ncbi:MAG: heme NO-binding domain-containing protein [Magnetococcales bacterium]|nr:heme NO-binding domain-containing protein [Magnetococcales bacterium]
MHGIIFLALEDFLESQGGAGTWSKAMREANLVEQTFSPDRFYPDESAIDLFAAAARVLTWPLQHTLEQWGRHMGPDLIAMGRSMGLIREEWRTLDILEHLPKDILAAFGNTSAGMKPPNIRTYRLKHGEVAVAYISERRLCALFKGIVLGVGAFFNESIRIEERLCLLKNAPLCRFSIYLDDPALSNHLEIMREFQTVHSRIQEIRFFNQFGGIPIVNQGLVLQCGATGVLVQIHPESLVAMREEQVTHLALPHLPMGLKSTVATVDWAHGTALLQNIAPTDGPIGRRVFPRVAPIQPIPVECRFLKETARGWLANLSEGGLCVTLPSDPMFNETLMFTPVKVRFILPMQTVATGTGTEPAAKILLDGNILYINEKAGHLVIRIIFKPLAVNDAHLIQTYYQEKEGLALRHLRSMVAAANK